MQTFKIVIPTFNCEKTIENCLNSIFSQTFKDFFIVIVDDCSTDRTVEIVEKKILGQKNVYLVKSDKKLYAGGARQIGIDYSTDSKYTWFVDGDDFLFSKNSLSIANELFEKNDIDLLLHDNVCFNGKQIFQLQQNRDFNTDDLRRSKHNQPWTRIVRSDKSGSFFSGNFLEDNYNFYTQLEKIDYSKILVSNEILYVNYFNPNSITRIPNGDWKNTEQYRRSFAAFSELLKTLTKKNLISTVEKILGDLNEILRNRPA